MSKDHLVPTPIVDKNGKPTVTYTKPGTPRDLTSGAIPAPSLSAKPNPTDVIVDRIAETLEFWQGTQYDKVRDTLNGYPDTLIKNLLEVPPTSDLWLSLSHLVADKEKPSVVNEALHFFPHLATKSLRNELMFMKALHSYPQLPPMEDYGQADDRTKEQCIAILTAAEMMEDGEGYIAYAAEPLPTAYRKDADRNDIFVIDEPKIIDLLMERPKDAKRIAEIIIDRRTRDTDIITMILDDNNPPLAEGIL